MNSILCPTDYLAAIVSTGGVAVVTTGEWRERSHQSILPTKTLADLSGGNSRREKRPAGKRLTERIIFVGVRDSDEEAAIVQAIASGASPKSVQSFYLISLCSKSDGQSYCKQEGRDDAPRPRAGFLILPPTRR